MPVHTEVAVVGSVMAPIWEKHGSGTFRCEVHLHLEEDGTFSIYAAALPGAASQGDTEEQALRHIEEAIAGAIEVYRESGQPIPWQSARRLEDGDKKRWVIVHA